MNNELKSCWRNWFASSVSSNRFEPRFSWIEVRSATDSANVLEEEHKVNVLVVEFSNKPGREIIEYHALKGVMIEFRTRKFYASFEQNAWNDCTPWIHVYTRTYGYLNS
jgi:hypothetical protein